MTPAPNSTQHAQDVDRRLQQIIAAINERGHYSLWNAHALMATAPGAERVIEIVQRGLNGSLQGNRNPDQPLTGGPFQVLPAALLLCRWQDDLPDEAVANIRELFTCGLQERGNTENHWLMYYVGNLLAAELWADTGTWWNGLTPAAMHAEAKRWILGMIDRTARLGHHEYDSTGYQSEHLTPYIGLADHAKDEEIRGQAEKMATLLVSDMALEHFHGAWAGGHAREGYRQNTWTRTGPIQGLEFAYFGSTEFDPTKHTNGFIAPATTARFRPPPVLAALAVDRDSAHVVRKTKASRTIFRHVEQDGAPVRKYTYMSPSFALGSSQIGLPGAPAGPIDLTSWDLSWNGPDHDAKIVCNHPYRSPGRFSAFLSDLPQSIGRSVGSGKPYLQFEDRLFGASPYERMMQHEGCVIVLYDIPDGDAAPFVNLYLPRRLGWHEREGWLLADPGGFYVGVRPLGRHRWLQIREGNQANIMVTNPDLIDGWLLRLWGNRIGLALEAVEADEAGSFQDYCAARVAAGIDLNDWPVGRRVAVDTLKGDQLDMTYDGPHRINGEAIDYDAYPLLDAPGVSAPLGTGQISFAHDQERAELDFGVDPDTPLLPMRVIG
jgi:hypothetical protein